MSAPFVNVEEFNQLRAQNEQLWKIIERQRSMIQNLQKENSHLAAERDGLQDNVNSFERARKQRASILFSPEALKAMTEPDEETSPMPPPRSPYRSNNAQNIQKFKINKPPPFVVPMPSVSSPVFANTPTDDSSLSSSFSSSSSYLRPCSPPVGGPTISSSSTTTATTMAQRTGNRSKREISSGGPMTGAGGTTSSPFAGGITNIAVKVLGSNIRQNEKNREVISFIIAVGKKPDEHNLEYEELWRVEKLYSHFLELDAKLKSNQRSVANRIAKLPDKALFTTNSPSKVDRRKAALEHYLQHIILLPMDDISDLCEFLSTNVVDNDVMYSRTGRKEGYLTKRGKNFGGWKTRYFVLHGSSLEYYESKDGNHLGTIRLVNAQIGRQTPGTSTSDENNIYRHAFLIVEQKRSGSSHVARHILCADSDEERDAWVDVLFKNVTLEEDKAYISTDTTQQQVNNGGGSVMKKKPSKSVSSKSGTSTKSGSSHESEFDKLRPSMMQDPSEIGVAVSGPTDFSKSINESSESLPSVWPSAPPIVFDQRTSLDQLQHATSSHTQSNNNNNNNSLQPRTPHHLTRRSSMVNLLNTNNEEIVLPARALSPSPAFGRDSDELLSDEVSEKKTKHKRMTFWGKKMFNNSNETLVVPSRPSPSSSSTTNNNTLDISSTSSGANGNTSASTSSGLRGFLSRPSNENGRSSSKETNQTPLHPVFGVPLEESVRTSRVSDTYQLPSIVFRCIEYLDAKKAVLEEGLYRLSGSNIMMKSLKQKFDLEGDINLLAAKEEYDVHAIAGLLKMWLRELPTSVLTREHRMDFLHVIDLLDRKDRVNELGRLVSILPIENYTLLRALTAHLIQVVQHSDVNKMTMRNVSIVFSPTLGIPGTIFNLLMSEFDYIFWTTEDGDAAPRMILDDEDTVYETPVKVMEETNGTTTGQTSQLGRRPTLQLRDGRSNRNSVNYREAAPNSIVGLEKQHHPHGQPLMLDEIEDDVNDLALTDDDYSLISDDKFQPTAITT
ncbi:uncharacterized protein BX664DRAFT_290183 [Halteromyces radiatus]|uniref:uncharacterized protein n=1 Tax=Halteromyces radiatus TaxID=101107 RepID=UPI00221F585F|nr:uncharacterized protein BX664DRAFT_290183 [Halteromyces radiatus]KAI8099830.1 hypothetical protein BX664DRAFT_290183 [Halteromyces radiatus]